jgi:hypothetical protein
MLQKGLELRYQSQIEVAKSAIHVLVHHATAVAEHDTAKLVDDLDAQLHIIADCKDKLDVLESLKDAFTHVDRT